MIRDLIIDAPITAILSILAIVFAIAVGGSLAAGIAVPMVAVKIAGMIALFTLGIALVFAIFGLGLLIDWIESR